MWQRFTEQARKVVFYAQEEAIKFGEGYVSTEHLLLGLVREDHVGAAVLEQMGVSLNRVRAEVEKQLPRGDARPTQDMTLTPRAKRTIDLAFDEARNLGNNYIGTEHLLLGLIREGDGLAGRVLAKLGVELEKARSVVIDIQERESGQPRLLRPVSEAAYLRGRFLPEHLILVMLANPESTAHKLIAAQCDNIGGLQTSLWLEIANGASDTWHRPVGIEPLLARAQAEAARGLVQSEHLLLAIAYAADSSASAILRFHGITYDQSRRLLDEKGPAAE